MNPLRSGQRVHPYKKFEKKLNFSGMTFPIDQSQIPGFEKQNDISIDDFMLVDENILLLEIYYSLQITVVPAKSIRLSENSKKAECIY